MEKEIATAAELGYGSQELCVFCTNKSCDRWLINHSKIQGHLIGVTETCPDYKNKMDGY